MSSRHAIIPALNPHPLAVIPPGTALDAVGRVDELEWRRTAALEALAPKTRRACPSAWGRWPAVWHRPACRRTRSGRGGAGNRRGRCRSTPVPQRPAAPPAGPIEEVLDG